jgi:hypothetical protein
MTTTINAKSSGAGGLEYTGDASGVLGLQANGSTIATISSTGVAVTGALTTTGAITSDGVVASPYTMKNRIINGDMRIDQRNAGASVTPTAAVYGLDRWKMSSSAASKYSFQQNAASVTPPVGFTNYLGITSLSSYTISSTDTFIAFQYIEGYNTADLAWGTANAKTVTLSFWVRSSLTGTFGGCLGNGNATRSYPFTYTISAANTWEQKTITIAGDTSGTWLTTTSIGIGLYLGFGVGSTYSGTAGAWAGAEYYGATGATSVVGTNGATFYITGVQFEVGSAATSFEWRPYASELELCQRYFIRMTGRNHGYVRHDGSFNSFFVVPTLMRTDQPTGTFTTAGAFTNFQSHTASSPSSFSVQSESKAATRGWLYIACTLGSYSSHSWIPSWEGFQFDLSSEL